MILAKVTMVTLCTALYLLFRSSLGNTESLNFVDFINPVGGILIQHFF